MLRMRFSAERESVFRVLCLGAHSDDIEIGCGGTVLRLLEEEKTAEVWWVIFGASGERAIEAKKSADLFLERAADKRIIIKDFRDGFFPSSRVAIKEIFEDLKDKFLPDLIFTHYRGDLHQDHRFVSELTWQTYRDHLILEYEILKYDGDMGAPNYFFYLDEATCQRKIGHIRNCFRSQEKRQWFTDDAFLSLLRIRGIESNAPGRYAEGFYCRKLVY